MRALLFDEDARHQLNWTTLSRMCLPNVKCDRTQCSILQAHDAADPIALVLVRAEFQNLLNHVVTNQNSTSIRCCKGETVVHRGDDWSVRRILHAWTSTALVNFSLTFKKGLRIRAKEVSQSGGVCRGVRGCFAFLPFFNTKITMEIPDVFYIAIP